MFCQGCGSALTPGSRFCDKCGTAVQAAGTPEQQVAPPVQAADAPVQQEVPQNQDYQQPAPPPPEPPPPPQPEYQAVAPPPPPPPIQQEYQQPQQYQPVAPPPPPPPMQPEYQPPQQYQQAAHPPPPPQQDYQAYQQYQPAPPYPDPAGPKKSKKKIIIPIIAAVVLLAAAAGAYFIFFHNSPERAAAKALSNVGTEFSQRLQDTPLEIFGLLFESLESGSITVDFDYRDMWSNSRGNITLHTDSERNEYALEAGMTVEDIRLDLDFFLNSEVAAVRVSQIDNNYYGIRFNTFRNDFRSFADLMGLGRQETDMIADWVDAISEALNADGNMEDFYSDYTDLFSSILTRAEVRSGKADLNSGGRSVRADKIDYIITDRLIFELLNDFADLLEKDDNIRAMFEAGDEFGGLYYGLTYDSMIREFRSQLREFERIFKGEIVVSLYIGSGDRLLQINANSNLQVDGEEIKFNMSLDFGSSAHDLWVFRMNTEEGRDSSEFAIEWEMNDLSGSKETRLRVIVRDRWSDDVSEVVLNWTNSGQFKLTMEEGRYSETLLSGTYNRNGDGFRLVIDDPFVDSYWDESLRLEISAARRSGRIEQVDFINISDWGTVLIEKIEDLLGFGSSVYNPPGMIDYALLGSWYHYDGAGTYFFWHSEFVYFDDSGFVMADEETGTWSASNGRLTVVDDSGSTYEFTYSIIGGTLSITDSDGDTGYFNSYAQAPAPAPPPPGIQDSDIVGAWTFLRGDFTYFFMKTSVVFFDDNGIVILDNEDGSDYKYGSWSVNGNTLTVVDDLYITYEFTFEITGNTLAITDTDYDTGYFDRLW